MSDYTAVITLNAIMQQQDYYHATNKCVRDALDDNDIGRAQY